MRCAAPEDDHVGGRLRRGLCERHYRRLRATGSTAPPVLIDDLTRYEIDPATGCHLWTGPLYPNGYGKTARKIHGTQLAHRAFWLAAARPIPAGWELDHVKDRGCRARHCVNLAHLEPVTPAVNIQRGYQARTVCRNGHDLTDPANVRPGTSQCIPCWRTRYRAAGKRYRERKRLAA
jgi:hypothetical protein